MRTPPLPFIALVSLASLAACGRDRAGPGPAEADRATVLATVNGVTITDADVKQRSRRAVTGGGPSHEQSGNVLQTIVRDELIYQKAVELGLDRQPEYRQRVDDLEAQLRAFRRQELGAIYRRHVQQQAAVTDAEAQAYFDENAAFIRTRFHVRQIFYKGRYPDIARDQQDLKSGMPFEQVASRRFAGVALEGRPPWDLGELYWFQLPPAWRGIVDRLEPRQVSDIIKGEGERSWVVELAGKRTDPAITFATERERIVEALRQRKADALYDAMLAELKDKARIVYSK